MGVVHKAEDTEIGAKPPRFRADRHGDNEGLFTLGEEAEGSYNWCLSGKGKGHFAPPRPHFPSRFSANIGRSDLIPSEG